MASTQNGGSPSTGLLCTYKSRRCSNPRALKRNGSQHTLCEFHRARQNEIQRKSDRKHRTSKLARQLNHRQEPVLRKEISSTRMTKPKTFVPIREFTYGMLPTDLPMADFSKLREALRAVTVTPEFGLPDPSIM
ncbi:hypothetical protein AC1031_000963 [Aphanomyces cochlioides]|nr:hypothetical protein AC1031_000963 [Aphanomyces cochlioides]